LPRYCINNYFSVGGAIKVLIFGFYTKTFSRFYIPWGNWGRIKIEYLFSGGDRSEKAFFAALLVFTGGFCKQLLQ